MARFPLHLSYRYGKKQIMKLRDYRFANALTLAQFAERIGVAEATISRYENGRIPEKKVMDRIHLATEGAVHLGDFYVPPVPSDGDAA